MILFNNKITLASNMPTLENVKNKGKTKKSGQSCKKGLANRAKLSRKLCQNYSTDSLVKSVTGATKDVLDLVTHQFFHFCARRTQIFPRVEFLGVLREHFANSRRHRHA